MEYTLSITCGKYHLVYNFESCLGFDELTVGEIENLLDDDFNEQLGSEFFYLVEEGFASYKAKPKRRDWGDTWEVNTDAAVKFLDSQYGNFEILLKDAIGHDKPVDLTDFVIDILKDVALSDSVGDGETSLIWGSQVIASDINEYFLQGKWHWGLCKNNETVDFTEKDIDSWPEPVVKSDGSISWRKYLADDDKYDCDEVEDDAIDDDEDSFEEYKPIMWFCLDNEVYEECDGQWIIYDYDDWDTFDYKDWKDDWFNGIYAFDVDESILYWWSFSGGVDLSPGINSCPIKFNINDSTEEVVSRMKKFVYDFYKQNSRQKKD